MADEALQPHEAIMRRIPADEQKILQRLSVLRWFDETLFSIVTDTRSRAAFKRFASHPLVTPVHGHADRFTVTSYLREALFQRMQLVRPREFKTINELAAKYFYRPLEELEFSESLYVVEELGYLALAARRRAEHRLVTFAVQAITAGWLETAYRAARLVGATKIAEPAESDRLQRLANVIAITSSLLSGPQPHNARAASDLRAAIETVPPPNDETPEHELIKLARGAVELASTSDDAVTNRLELDTYREPGFLARRDVTHSDLAQSALNRSGTIDVSRTVAQQTDIIHFSTDGPIRRQTNITLTFEAWRNGLAEGDSAGMFGLAVSEFPWIHSDIIDSVRVTNGDGDLLGRLTANESRTLVAASLVGELERSSEVRYQGQVAEDCESLLAITELLGSDGSDSILQDFLNTMRKSGHEMFDFNVPLVVASPAANISARQLRFEYEEPWHSTTIHYSLTGMVDLAHEMKLADVETLYVEVVTPSGLVAIASDFRSREFTFDVSAAPVDDAVVRSRARRSQVSQRFRITSSRRDPRGRSRQGSLRLTYSIRPSKVFNVALTAAASSLVSLLVLLATFILDEDYPLRSILLTLIPAAATVYGFFEIFFRARPHERPISEDTNVYRRAALPMNILLGVSLSDVSIAAVVAILNVGIAVDRIFFAISMVISGLVALGTLFTYANLRTRLNIATLHGRSHI